MTLAIPSLNGTPQVEYRAIDGHPVPGTVTVQRRVAGSDWQTVTLRHVRDQLRLGGPVAEWLRAHTRVDCSPARWVTYQDLECQAYCWNADAEGAQ